MRHARHHFSIVQVTVGFPLRLLIVLITGWAGLCLALAVLLRSDALLGMPLGVGIMALAIWSVVALLGWVAKTKHRPTRDRSKSTLDRRPWQFSLRSLFVLTAICAGMCSTVKTLPPTALLLVLYLGVVFLVTAIFLAGVVFIVAGVIALIEWPLVRRAGRSSPQDKSGEPS
jgi:hypothetical protein